MVTHIELTEREKTIAGFSGDMIAVMELAFPQDAGSRSLYLEEWVDGSLVGSDILMQGDGEANMTCYLLSDIDKREDGTWSGTTWKMILESDGTVRGRTRRPGLPGQVEAGGRYPETKPGPGGVDLIGRDVVCKRRGAGRLGGPVPLRCQARGLLSLYKTCK